MLAATAAPSQQPTSVRFLDSAAREALERARTAVLGGRAPEDFRSLLLKGRLRVGVSRDQAVDGAGQDGVAGPGRGDAQAAGEVVQVDGGAVGLGADQRSEPAIGEGRCRAEGAEPDGSETEAQDARSAPAQGAASAAPAEGVPSE